MTGENPRGQVTIRTIAMPRDTNANGDIFGGWLLSQMDLAAGVLGKEHSRGRIATVAIQSMTFLLPVKVGDMISCYAEMLKVGRTSMTMHIEAWVHTASSPTQLNKVTEGTFVLVAIDDTGRPRPIPT